MTISVPLFLYALAIAALVGAWLGYEERGHHDAEDAEREDEAQAGRPNW